MRSFEDTTSIRKQFDESEETENEETVVEEEEEEEMEMEVKEPFSYKQTLIKFWNKEDNWNKEEVLAIIWIIRLFMALPLGLFVGLCKIPVILGQVVFVLISSKYPVTFLTNRLAIDPVEIVNDPRRIIKHGSITVHMLFIVCSIGSRVFLGLKQMEASSSPQ